MKSLGLSAVVASVALLSGVVASPLTTIEPCPSATGHSFAPITVTSQYQPVSTCEPTTACVKGKCATSYPFVTYPYVSTIVPCAWNGTTTQKATVTEIAQPLKVSEHLETLTHITSAPVANKFAWIDWFNKDPITYKEATLYETVTRRAIAPYNAVGPLPIPGWEGSGLCKKCVNDNGTKSQLLEVTECRIGTELSGKPYAKCVEWFETLIAQPPKPVTARGHCSSSGKIDHAGVYTWTFPQVAPPVTVTAPPKTVTVTVNGRPQVSVHRGVHIIPGKPWDAFVTRSFSGPTVFNFNVYVTKVFIVNIPYFTQPAQSTVTVTVPAGPHKGDPGHGGWWPLPSGHDNWGPSDGGSKAWEDWNPTTSSTTTSLVQRQFFGLKFFIGQLIKCEFLLSNILFDELFQRQLFFSKLLKCKLIECKLIISQFFFRKLKCELLECELLECKLFGQLLFSELLRR
ncbi:hypothetical protein RBB50_004437 [Rhinocladiella similis]